MTGPGRSAAPGRALAGAAVTCLAGAGLVLYAAGRDWAVEVTGRPAPLPAVEVARAGADVLPWLPAVALVGLAGTGAVLATRGLARRLVGALLAALGVALAAGGLTVLLAGAGPAGPTTDSTVSAPQWPALTVIGAVLLVAGGLVTALRSRHWPAMGARYERSRPGGDGSGGDRSSRSTLDAWNALDRGEDPTADDPGADR
ncbi:putative membrane protein (TIGR02234 family) [Micromonospora sp. Llam0]|uniref:Trp biosynthesis-associated membrane protein n=1 Tax=Micromonospora sp. Llam0 TaxID=2485143 RepID=UPI000F460714|nr:Trp biosynthesis-associated membrane protein [Micromonospora sp. Llam0]ROO61211.1 putative membrane protein (TIGR02234 family) [Micromonospora sp. Llam0]